MQIIVKDSDNKPPRITVPPEVCVEAGTLIRQTITATDQPSRTNRRDRLTLTAFSGVFGSQSGSDSLIALAYATFSTPAQPQAADPATGLFTWQTNCAHVRQQPYDVLFKVGDNPPAAAGGSLVDSKIFRIRVVAPKPKNLRAMAAAGGRAFVLTWDAYACGAGKIPDGVKMVIYRKEGCDNKVIDPCLTLPPAGLRGSGAAWILARTPSPTPTGEKASPWARATATVSRRPTRLRAAAAAHRPTNSAPTCPARCPSSPT